MFINRVIKPGWLNRVQGAIETDAQGAPVALTIREVGQQTGPGDVRTGDAVQFNGRRYEITSVEKVSNRDWHITFIDVGEGRAPE